MAVSKVCRFVFFFFTNARTKHFSASSATPLTVSTENTLLQNCAVLSDRPPPPLSPSPLSFRRRSYRIPPVGKARHLPQRAFSSNKFTPPTGLHTFLHENFHPRLP